MNVGDLRQAMDGLPDETMIAVETVDMTYPLRRAWSIASDCYPKPFGTDPMTEDTVAVFVLTTLE